MDNQIKTSFIPRKNIDTAVDFQAGGSLKSNRNVARTIFSFIATLILLAIIAGGVLTYFWQIKLKKDITDQVSIMESSKKNFNDDFVKASSRLDTRIQEAMFMLENHVSPSAVYSLLQEYTLKTVSFSSFSFQDNHDGTINISGSGEALKYETIVLQSDSFGKSGYMRNVIFTDLRADLETKRVGFTFKATLEPKLIFYKDSLSSKNKTD